MIHEIWDRADAAAGGPDDYSTQAIRHVLAAHHTTFRKKFASFAVWNRIPRQRYSEGKAGRYPTPVGSGSFALGAANTSTGWLAVKLKHMSSIYVTFKPGRSDGPRAHLTVQFDGPRYGYGPEGRLMVFTRSGAVAVKTYKLNRNGDGSLRVGFGRGHVSKVVLIETNASTRFTCGTRIAVLVRRRAARRRPRLRVPGAHQLVHQSLQLSIHCLHGLVEPRARGCAP